LRECERSVCNTAIFVFVAPAQAGA